MVQETRDFELSTPLGKDVLLITSVKTFEALSRPFQFDVEVLSERHDIGLHELLGKNASVSFDVRTGTRRHFHGVVSEFSYVGQSQGMGVYRLTLRPWFWLLTRNADCRVFQNMTVPDIVKQVFASHGFSADVAARLTGAYRTWDYCVQYRETDFNFCSRLLEQEGIYYFFEHTADKHTLVLADSYSSHETQAGYEKVPYFPRDTMDRRERDHLHDWSLTSQVRSGKHSLNEYNYHTPKTSLLASAAQVREHAHSDYEIYDYPGEYPVYGDGETYAKIRREEAQADHERVRGEGNARGLMVGALFELESYPRADQNREYLIVHARHELRQRAVYQVGASSAGAKSFLSSVEAMNAREPFRPRRLTPKPSVQGPQTAVVVGPAGQEIYTDPEGLGRVKVQFHWDRYGKHDENSSCWVRVSSPWAGKAWGGVSLPRIGQEVIVDFIEGDPDRPIITGRVYNADNMPPYAFPADKTQSGIKSRSSEGGTPDNFNEIRFEDKIGQEQIYVHAERDHDTVVENNQTIRVGFDDTSPGDRSLSVHNDERIDVGRDRTKSVGRDQAETIGQNDTTSVGKDQTVDVKNLRGVTIGKNDTLKVGKELLVDVGDQIVFKTGSASITMKKDGTILVQGKDITIKGSGNVVIKGKKILEN